MISRAMGIMFAITLQTIPFSECFQLSNPCRPVRRLNSLKAGIDVSGLQMVPVPDDFFSSASTAVSTGVSSSMELTTDDIQNFLIIISALGLYTYETRPRGWAQSDLIEVRRSTIQSANLGVFCKKFIAEGTVIGAFPGFLRTKEKALSNKENGKAQKKAMRYLWSLDEETVLDPTNTEGNLELELKYLGGFYKVDTIVARINEPSKGGDCNLFTKIVGSEVQVIAERSIFPDEELFIDYGPEYDRSEYVDKQKALDKDLQTQRLREETEMMQLEPITTTDLKSSPGNQDTTVAGGYISKLSQQKENVFKNAGILTPEEGLEMFAELGPNMFTSAEDQEMLRSLSDSLSGSAKRAGLGADSTKGILRPEDAPDVLLGRKSADPNDEDLLASLLDQIPGSSGTSTRGSGAKKGNDGILTPESAATMFGVGGDASGSSGGGDDDDDLMASLAKQLGSDNMKTLTEATMPNEIPPSANNINVNSKDQSSPRSAKATPTAKIIPTPAGTALSAEEADDLQNRLDQLTDEQVEKVFAKLRESLGQGLQDEFSVAMQEKKLAEQALRAKAPQRVMPRSQSLDPKIRAKYNRELTAIEDELEKMYSDPLGVWQQLATNPDKFLAPEKPLDDEELQ